MSGCNGSAGRCGEVWGGVGQCGAPADRSVPAVGSGGRKASFTSVVFILAYVYSRLAMAVNCLTIDIHVLITLHQYGMVGMAFT